MVRSSRLGIAVRGDTICMVLRRGAVRVDILSMDRPADTAWEAFWEKVLEEIPARVRSRTSLFVALDAPRFRCKRLFDVAHGTTESELRALLDSEAHSFFVSSSGPLVVGDPVRHEDGWWAGAAPASEVEMIVRACTAAGVRLAGIVPLDDAAARDGLPEAVWSIARLADAPPFVIDPLRADRSARERRRGGYLFLSALLVLLSVSVFAPTMLLQWKGSRLRHSVESERRLLLADTQVYGAAMRALALERIAAEIHEETTPAVETLSRLVLALPDGAVIVNASFDSATVLLTVLAPVSVDLVSALGRVPGLSAPTLVGALSREPMAGADVQRTRLAFRATAADARTPPAQLVRR